MLFRSSRYAKASVLKQYAAERSENTERLWYLLGKVVEMIRCSKRNHDKLEEYYIEAMDFNLVNAMREQVITDIFANGS